MWESSEGLRIVWGGGGGSGVQVAAARCRGLRTMRFENAKEGCVGSQSLVAVTSARIWTAGVREGQEGVALLSRGGQ